MAREPKFETPRGQETALSLRTRLGRNPPRPRGSKPARTTPSAKEHGPRGRVEIWRGSIGMFRFQIPLIKPDVRIARIRLSDKLGSFRPRQVSTVVLQTEQSELLVEILIAEAGTALSADFVLSA